VENTRGVRGRMTTTYADPNDFDHGTQYVTAKSTNFKELLKPMIDNGISRTGNLIMLKSKVIR
ncbi:NADP transhydrogenase subunit alpha, partial [Francisella tularensis subsp. holarctica]|nr:NADP transhydrogenase subunit alpha [Francisella tularensis subsp. holarctica]